LNIAIAVQSTLLQGGIRAKIITGTGNQIYGAMRDRQFSLLAVRCCSLRTANAVCCATSNVP
ncbi:hypothetical protein HZD82_27845, partial [Pantoea agglomerans]|nr:hypothetical protein [Pantoea agglomerans]